MQVFAQGCEVELRGQVHRQMEFGNEEEGVVLGSVIYTANPTQGANVGQTFLSAQPTQQAPELVSNPKR